MTAAELVRRVAAAPSFELVEARDLCRRWLAESDARSAERATGQGTLL